MGGTLLKLQVEFAMLVVVEKVLCKSKIERRGRTCDAQTHLELSVVVNEGNGADGELLCLLIAGVHDEVKWKNGEQ